MRTVRVAQSFFVPIALGAFIGCKRDEDTIPVGDGGVPTAAGLDVPASVIAQLGQPLHPADNPLTQQGIALGRKLFYENALSDDQSMSCGSCHKQANAFADPSPFTE